MASKLRLYPFLRLCESTHVEFGSTPTLNTLFIDILELPSGTLAVELNPGLSGAYACWCEPYLPQSRVSSAPSKELGDFRFSQQKACSENNVRCAGAPKVASGMLAKY